MNASKKMINRKILPGEKKLPVIVCFFNPLWYNRNRRKGENLC